MQVKKRIFAGAVCDQIVYTVSDRARSSSAPARERFKNELEREEHSRRKSRKHHALVINANYGPTSYFVTLTLNRENEAHDFIDARILRDKYYRKLRRAYPDSKINIYMGKGKNTARIHYHMIIDGVPEDFIIDKWTFGSISRIEHLREHNYSDGVDLGRDYTALANYCFDHWTKEQDEATTRRYLQSRTVQQPEEEEPTKCHWQYSEAKPPQTPKGYIYVGCEYCTSYGYMHFHYVMKPPPDKNPEHTKHINKYR